MDRRDAYHGQVVTEGDVDEWFDDVEDTEKQLALDAAVRQAKLADTPSSSIYGGILAGLAVVGVDGNDYVTVALGSARDDDGEHIKLTGAATVKLSHTGLTTIAEDTDAVGDGAAIAGGSCAAGKRIVISLFAAAARDLQDQKTDAGGATIDYDQLESFRFYLAVGSSDYTHANVMAGTETPTRAALANDYVLLADLLVENSAGTMVFRAVMNTTPQWCGTYNPPGNYASLTGRRSDWLVLQTTDEFTTAEGAEDVIRGGTAREALYDLGRRVRSEAFTAHRTLTAPALFSMRKRFGHPCRPHELFDDFLYSSGVWDPTNFLLGDNWNVVATAGAFGVAGDNYITMDVYAAGGAASLVPKAAAGNGFRMYSSARWNLGAAPWAVALFRFRVNTSSNSQAQQLGFTETIGVNQNQVGVQIGTNITAYGYDSTGAIQTATLLAPIVVDTYYTVRIAVLSNKYLLFQLNNGAWTTITLTGTLASANYMAYAQVHTIDGALRVLTIDQAYAADAQLSADMA